MTRSFKTHSNIPGIVNNYKNCQIMMFGADFNPSCEKYAKLYFRSYKKTIKIRAESKYQTQTGRAINTSINERIKQEVIFAVDYETDPRFRQSIVQDQKKNKIVFDLLDKEMPRKVLVFIETKKDVDRLYDVIASQNRWDVGFIHNHTTVNLYYCCSSINSQFSKNIEMIK